MRAEWSAANVANVRGGAADEPLGRGGDLGSNSGTPVLEVFERRVDGEVGGATGAHRSRGLIRGDRDVAHPSTDHRAELFGLFSESERGRPGQLVGTSIMTCAGQHCRSDLGDVAGVDQAESERQRT